MVRIYSDCPFPVELNFSMHSSLCASFAFGRMPLLDFAISDEVQAGLDSVHGSVVLIAVILASEASKRGTQQHDDL